MIRERIGGRKIASLTREEYVPRTVAAANQVQFFLMSPAQKPRQDGADTLTFPE